MTPHQMRTDMETICQLSPVIPVLVVKQLTDALPLAKALHDGGLKVLEITLRTPCSLDAIKAMGDIKGCVVGAGTLLTPEDVKAAKQAGARFGVSPGATDAIIDACMEYELPLLPGAATATEMMMLLEHGFSIQKFFPAQASGGASALAAFASPLPQIRFCPTGGITPDNAPQYLALPNTVCVGGSWMAPGDLIAQKNWTAITDLSRKASSLGA